MFNEEAWWFAISAPFGPGKPTGFSVAVSPGTVRLRAMVDDGGRAITKWQYRVATTNAGVSSASWVDFSSSASSTLDKSLAFTAGATRHYQVRAVNAVGNGPGSDILRASDNRVAPLAPTGFTVTATSAGRFRLRATVDDGGAAISKWQYRIATTSGGVSTATWTDVSSSASSSLDFTPTATYGGGVTRHFQVRAVNTIGNGAASSTVSGTTEDVVTTDTDSIYIRGTTAPGTPTGGTNAETHLPSGWSRANPGASLTQSVYRSQRTRTYTNGSFTSATAWGAVTKVADNTATEPEKPTGFSATPSGPSTGSGTVRLRASVDNGGVAITKWQYRVATTNAGVSSASWTDFSSSASSTLDKSLTLAAGVTRHYQVRAVNSIGNGPASDIDSARVARITRDTDSIYRRGTTAPGAPSGGTGAETHLPSGWSRANPGASLTQNVYRSQRTRTYHDGVFQSASAWGAVTRIAGPTSVLLTTVGSGTWTVPAGVSSVQVQLVGAGGGGGTPDRAGGGGGGATTWGTGASQIRAAGGGGASGSERLIVNNTGIPGTGGAGGGQAGIARAAGLTGFRSGGAGGGSGGGTGGIYQRTTAFGGGGGAGDTTNGNDGQSDRDGTNPAGADGGTSGANTVSALATYGNGGRGGGVSTALTMRSLGGGGGGGGGGYTLATRTVSAGGRISYFVGGGGGGATAQDTAVSSDAVDGAGGAIRIVYV